MVKEAVQDLSSVAGPEGFKINDVRVLTAQEHRLIGSTPEFDPETHDPFKPQCFFNGSVSPEETLRLRREQGYIVSHSASSYFGFKGEESLKYAVIIELSEIDPDTGDVVDREPRLIGLLYKRRLEDDEIGRVITDPEILKKHHLTKAGKQRLLFQERLSSV